MWLFIKSFLVCWKVVAKGYRLPRPQGDRMPSADDPRWEDYECGLDYVMVHSYPYFSSNYRFALMKGDWVQRITDAQMPWIPVRCDKGQGYVPKDNRYFRAHPDLIAAYPKYFEALAKPHDEA